jgi:hypothetical protein
MILNLRINNMRRSLRYLNRNGRRTRLSSDRRWNSLNFNSKRRRLRTMSKDKLTTLSCQTFKTEKESQSLARKKLLEESRI